MAKIVEYRDIPLANLIIGKGQARTRDVGAEIDELAKSIEVQGQLQPIVVCPAEQDSKWEILSGQRRFLAHQKLNSTTISAAIISERVDAGTAKAISITENLIRRKLTGSDLKDGIKFLYNQYGSEKDVHTATGLSMRVIKDNLFYDRLKDDLKKKVDDGDIDIKVAVKAQDSATDEDGEVNMETALVLAQEMPSMTGVQQSKTASAVKSGTPVDEAIEQAKSGKGVTQIMVTVTKDVHAAIKKFATTESLKQDEAVAQLVEESLLDRNYLNPE